MKPETSFLTLFIILFSGHLATAQIVYADKRFEKTLILTDTLTHFFKNCTFLSTKEGLVLGPQNRAVLDSCQFEGPQTGLAGNGRYIMMRNCSFRQCKKAIQLKSPGKSQVQIRFCRFEQNETAISIHQLAYHGTPTDSLAEYYIFGNDFDQNETAIEVTADPKRYFLAALFPNCNRFIPHPSSKNGSIGIKIGENVRLRWNSIGGDFESSNPYPPGGNVWPISGKINRHYYPNAFGSGLFYCDEGEDETCWKSPDKWTSIVNFSGNQLNYYRYQNEFVGHTHPARNMEIRYVQQLGFTRANGLNPETARGVFLCDSVKWAEKDAFFPVEIPKEKYLELWPENAFTPWIGKHRWKDSLNLDIPYQWPIGKTGELFIQTPDLIQTIQRFPLSERKGYFSLKINGLKSGVYAYTLHVDGSPVQTRKLVVVR